MTESIELLHILMIAPQPFFSARGTPFSVLHRIRALLELGHTVDLITYGYGEDIGLKNFPSELRIIRSRKLPGVNRVKIGPSIPKIFLDILLYWKTRKILKDSIRKGRQYDVIHSHEEAAFWAMPLSKKYNLPHLYDMHSSLPQQLSNFKSYNLNFLRSIFEKLENKVLDTSNGVITICDDLAKIAEARVPDTPHKMIENIGDDSKVFSPSPENMLSELNLSGKRVLLYTGTFEAYQGIDLLIDSLPVVKAKHPDVVTVLVGGRDDQIALYQKQAESLGVQDVVRFTGTVHPSQIPNFLQVCELIVSPRSRGTNTPLKIYNYMRQNRPLVATDRHTHTQILNPDVSCLVDATPESFAAGIMRVLNDKDYAQKLSDSAKRFADEHFSDENYVSMVKEVYTKMLHQPCHKTPRDMSVSSEC
ncbi:MAG: glycosyltransferase family 4 protein [Arenicella sp.]